jgi:hypothetical protein
VMASTLALAADEQRKRGTVRRCPNLCLRTDATASDDDADDRDLRFRPNSAVQLRRTAPAARRSHSWRAIVPTRPDPAMPMATFGSSARRRARGPVRSHSPGGLDRLCVSRAPILHIVSSALLSAKGGYLSKSGRVGAMVVE